MAGGDNLENLIARVVEKMMAGRYSERHALVTSYDSKKYLAKVKFMPYGQQSGWLPIETGHIGQGYGIAIGLQPGSGDAMGAQGGGSPFGGGGMSGGQQANAQSGTQDSMGDQVVVRFQETDFEAGKIVQRVHSQKDKPPAPVESGEIMVWTKFKKDQDSGPDAAKDGTGGTGCKIYFKNDGSLTTEDGNGASRKMDGNGNYTVTSGNQQKSTKILHQIVQNNPGIGPDDTQEKQPSNPKHYTKLETKNGARTSVFNEQHYTTWDQNGVTHSSQNSVTSQAPQIPHIGNTSVTQNLSVGQIVTAANYTTTSDVRLKTDIAPLPPMLDKLMKLEVKTFCKQSDPAVSLGMTYTAPGIGLIAQEVREVFPEMVHGEESKCYLSINEPAVGMALIAAFQEFVLKTRAEIADLKAQLDA
jgi:hypothetical protein